MGAPMVDDRGRRDILSDKAELAQWLDAELMLAKASPPRRLIEPVV